MIHGAYLFVRVYGLSDRCGEGFFILYNNSGDKVYYGRDYTITYEDTDGVWRGLPTDRIVVLIAYGAENGGA